jgi:hypothetical protein
MATICILRGKHALEINWLAIKREQFKKELGVGQ